MTDRRLIAERQRHEVENELIRSIDASHAIAGLPPRQRLALVLVNAYGCSINQLAKMFRCTWKKAHEFYWLGQYSVKPGLIPEIYAVEE